MTQYASEMFSSDRLSIPVGGGVDVRFGPATAGPIRISIEASTTVLRAAVTGVGLGGGPLGPGTVGPIGPGGPVEPPLPPPPQVFPIEQSAFEVEVFNGDGKSLGKGVAPLTVMGVVGIREGITIIPKTWRVHITNRSPYVAMTTVTAVFMGNKAVIARPLDLELINHKFDVIFNDVQPVRVTLKNRTESRQIGSQTVNLTFTDLALELHPEWALVHRHMVDLGHTFFPGFMPGPLTSQGIRLKAAVVEDRPAIHLRVSFSKSRIDLGDLAQMLVDKFGEAALDVLPAIDLPEITLDVFFVLRTDAVVSPVFAMVPSFDVRVHANVGGAASLAAAGLELAVKKAVNKIETEKVLHAYARKFLGWTLGDQDARVAGARAQVALHQVSQAPGPLVFSDGTGSTTGAPLDPGNLARIDHIVVVMMENRSFDHMLGYLSLPVSGNEGRNGRGRTDVDGLTGFETNPADIRTGERVRVFPHASTRILQDPGHSFDDAKAQRGGYTLTYLDTPGGGMPNPPPNLDPEEWRERFLRNHQKQFAVGDNQGFVLAHKRKLARSYADLKGPALKTAQDAVMGYYAAAQLPTYDHLAQNFAVCDRWFAAHPGHTWPNRFITLTGNLIRGPNGLPQVDNPALDTFEPLTVDTIFDHLSTAQVPWRCYEHNFSFIRLFNKYTLDRTHVRDYLPAPDLQQGGFAADVRNGLWMDRPSVTIIEPRIIDISPANANDDHPPGDLGNGQRFIGDVLRALQARPEVWAKTLLIVTYDEHGGFHDHVHPPAGVVNPMFNDPDTGEPVTYRGFRVPAFVVSPFVPKGSVSHDVYDHTSIIKTIMACFLSANPPAMGPRVAAANHVGPLLSLSQPRPLDTRPPVVAAVRKRSGIVLPADDDDFRKFLEGVRAKFAPTL